MQLTCGYACAAHFSYSLYNSISTVHIPITSGDVRATLFGLRVGNSVRNILWAVNVQLARKEATNQAASSGSAKTDAGLHPVCQD